MTIDFYTLPHNYAYMGNEIYNQEYYSINKGTEVTLKSAREIIPIVLDLITIKSVLDVGCGIGAWLKVFKEKGVNKIMGIDGNYVNKNMLLISKDNFKSVDLEKEEFKTNTKYDLTICLETAEHISKEREDHLLNILTNSADIVLFSASVPYQGGTGQGHINEQWQSYWIDKFIKRKYIAIDCIRRKIWSNKELFYFYRQNIFLFIKKDKLNKFPKLKKEFERGIDFIDIVAPDRYIEMGEDRKAIGYIFPIGIRKYFSFIVRKIAKIIKK